jgi:hypothetical protein
MQKNFSLLDDFFLDFVQVVKPKVQVAVEKKVKKSERKMLTVSILWDTFFAWLRQRSTTAS